LVGGLHDEHADEAREEGDGDGGHVCAVDVAHRADDLMVAG